MAFSLSQLSYRRLRITVIVVLVVLICVPVVLAGLALFWIAQGSITHEVEDRLTSLASDQAARLTDWIEEREFDLGAIGHLTTLNYWARQATQSDPRAGDSLAAILERVRLVGFSLHPLVARRGGPRVSTKLIVWQPGGMPSLQNRLGAVP